MQQQKTECINCARLGSCKLVTAEKLIEHFVCVEWKQNVKLEEVFARMRAVNLFGFQAAETLVKPDI